MKILLIEDDYVDQLIFERKFESDFNGLELVVAKSLKAAHKQLQQQSFDIVISDFHLRDGSVLEILDYAKQQDFVVVSGRDETEEEIVALQSKITAFIQKDFEMNYLDQLMQLIRKKMDSGNLNNSTTDTATKKEFKKLYDFFDGNKTEILNVLTTFQKNTPKELKEMEKAIQEKRFDRLGEIAHKIKSGFRLLNLKKAYNAAEQIEQLAKAKSDNAQILALFQQIEDSTTYAHQKITTEIDKLNGA